MSSETAIAGTGAIVADVPAAPAALRAESKTKPLRRLAIRGSLWTMIGYGSTQALRLGSNLLLTRLLFPEAFGLMALVNVFIHGIEMFSDVGIGPAIIQHKRGNQPDFLNTAWTIGICRGFALWLIACGLALPIAWFYGKPELAMLFPVAALQVVIMGFKSTKVHSLSRDLALGRKTALQLASHVVGMTVMALCAWQWRSVWALVVGGLAGTLFHSVLSHTVLPGPRNRWQLDKRAMREIAGFGRWIFLSTACSFLVMQGDRLILGKFLTLEQLGVFAIAIFMVQAAGQAFRRVTMQALYPALSEVARNDASRLMPIYIRLRRYQDIAMAGLAALFAYAGPALIGLLYDERYAEAGWMLQIVSAKLVIAYPQALSSSLLMSIGEPKYSAYSNVLRLVALSVGMPLGFIYYGLPGGIIVGTTALALGLPPLWIGLKRNAMFSLKTEFAIFAYFLAGYGALVLLGYVAGFGAPGWTGLS